MAYLDPLLTRMWYHHDGVGEEADQEFRKKWPAILKTAASKELELVLIPLNVAENWPLLALQSSF